MQNNSHLVYVHVFMCICYSVLHSVLLLKFNVTQCNIITCHFLNYHKGYEELNINAKPKILESYISLTN